MDFVDVSIIITCFNKEEFLNECMESVRRQTKQAREIILVHDGCENPQAHVISNTLILNKNWGVAKAREQGYRLSTAKLLLFVDADDVLSPDYLEKMILVIANGADIAYSDTYFWASEKSELFITPDIINPEFIEKYQKPVITISSMMKREVYEKVGGFREWGVLEDVDFWLRAMCNHYTFKKAQTLLWYRQTSNGRNTEKYDYLQKKEILNKILLQFIIKKDKVSFNG